MAEIERYTNQTEDFIGRGWGFPLRTDANGRIGTVSKDREIGEAIRLILGTAQGERSMRPEFGSKVHEHMFAPVHPHTAMLITFDVKEALGRWEPRIELSDVNVTWDEEDRSIIYINIAYTIRATNEPRNLVFPFYSIPPGGED